MPIFKNLMNNGFIDRWRGNMSDGYQPGDIFKSIFNVGTNQSAQSVDQSYEDIQERYWEAQNEAALQQQEAAQASAEKAMKFSHDEALLQRDWQEKMSNTAYQRAMKDMRAAGLNPVLMFSKGFSSASTPSGAAGTGSSASMSAAEVDTDALVSLLRESMSNQSAQNIAVMNNATKILTSILGSSKTVTYKK